MWTLEELGEPYELIVMDSDEGRGEAHRARHPLGKVPVLEDDEGFIFESPAICMHLADLRPDGGLAPPPGTHARALMYQWVCFTHAELEPPLLETAIHAEKDPERSAKARAKFDRAVEVLSGALGDRDYLIGDFSVADIMASSTLGFTTRMGMSDALPHNLRDYLARVAERPAHQRSIERMSS